MLSSREFEQAVTRLAFLKGARAEVLEEFRQSATLARIPAGQDVFLEGDRVEGIALLISGSVRVYKIGETGREITLYRFGNGESCILTANAILSQSTFPAIATVEKDAEAVMVPAEKFEDWVRRHDVWREFVFRLLSQRLATVMAIVEEIAFRRMDARVAELLLKKNRAAKPVRMTHQEIASELGSSREVISRLLEDFAERGLVRVGRGEVEVLDEGGLERRAGT